MSLIHFSCKFYYSIILHNKTPIYSAWGLFRVCVACPTPRLNQSYELRPPWEQHLRYVPHRVRNGYNNVMKAQGMWGALVDVRRIALYSFCTNCGARLVCVIQTTLQPLNPHDSDSVKNIQETRLATGPVWTGENSRPLYRVSNPERYSPK